MMLRGEVLDVGADNVVYVKIPQKYGDDSVKAVTRISVSKGDLVYVTDTSVSRVPQWVVFDQMNAVGSWGSPYPHTHPMGQVTGLVSKLGEVAANITKLFDRTKNAKDYGAKGDGVADDTAALQAAMDATAGKKLFIPAGRYVVSDVLRVRAGSTVFGEPGTVIVTSKRLPASVIRASGYLSAARQVELSGAVGSGDRVITTKTDHGYTAGDIIKFQSQRVATSPDAGEWRLGWPTVGSSGPRFAEFARIESVQSTRQFTLDSGLIFPGYRGDRTQETDTGAGDSTIIMKSDGAGDRVTIRDLEFEGEAREFIRFVSCVEPVAENIRVRVMGESPSRAVQFIDCYLGEARRVHGVCDVPILATEDHATRNLIHIAGSHSTGAVDCRVTRGTQCYDITYAAPSTTEHTSVFCYVRDSESVSAIGNPITMHPGTYGSKVTGNQFTECQKSGIAIRSNYALVSNNQIQGSMAGTTATDNPGIYCSEGGGKNSLITGNAVSSFRVGFRLNDGGGKPFTGWAGPTVVGNEFSGFVTGAVRTRIPGVPVAESQGIILKQNTFVTDQANAVGVLTCDSGYGVNGWSITGNDFRLPRTASTGVKVVGPSGDVVVKGNVFHSVGRHVSWDPTGVSADSPLTVLHWSDNTSLDVGIDRYPTPNRNFQIQSLDTAIMNLPAESYSLDNALYTARFYSTNTAATAARGWPVENFDGWVDIVRMSSLRVQQTGYGTDGRVHTRLWKGSEYGWSSWQVSR